MTNNKLIAIASHIVPSAAAKIIV